MATKTAKSKMGPKATKIFGKNAVRYTLPAGKDGPLQINVNFGLATEPLQYYYADCVHLTVDQELRMASLSFGHRDASTIKFADRIEIVMPANALFRQFWAGSRQVEDTVDKILVSIKATPKVQSISSQETSPTATLFANLIFVGVGEGESVLDFYQLSPRAVHFAKTEQKDIHIEPVIRVFVSTILIKSFFNAVRPYVEENIRPHTIEGGNKLAASRSR